MKPATHFSAPTVRILLLVLILPNNVIVNPSFSNPEEFSWLYSTIIMATQRQGVVDMGDFVLHMEDGKIASVVGQQGRHGTSMQRPAVHPSLTHVQYGRSYSTAASFRDRDRDAVSPGWQNGRCGVRDQKDIDDLWAACSGLLQAGGKRTAQSEGVDANSILGNAGTLDSHFSRGEPTAESCRSSPVEVLSPKHQHAVGNADPFSLGLPANAHAWLENAEASHLLEQSNRQSSTGNYGFFASFQVTPALERASTNLEQASANLPSPTGVASSNVSPAHAHHRRASGAWPAYLSERDTVACHQRRPSASDTLSVAGTASPARINSNQPFMGFPQAWGNMKATGSCGALSDLPLSTRAGDSNTPRMINGLDAASRQDGVCGGSSLQQSDSKVALQAFFDSEALDAEESSEQGHVKLLVYLYVFRCVGWPLVAVTLCSLILMQALKTVIDVRPFLIFCVHCIYSPIRNCVC